uniref:Uncharacterized protein n=1 Tax=Arundo donax TaxID=35708 RepID=A0A0A9BYP8_ARUDO
MSFISLLLQDHLDFCTSYYHFHKNCLKYVQLQLHGQYVSNF